MSDCITIDAVFDYTNFLGESSEHHWTFSEVFGLSWLGDKAKENSKSLEQKLWESAMHKMSAQHSDEENILELIQIATKQKIHALKLVMPYDLSTTSVEYIESLSGVRLEKVETDEFIVLID